MDAILGTLAGYPIYAFAVLLDAGVAVGLALATWLGRRMGLSVSRLLDAAAIALVAALVGARLGYVLLHWPEYAAAPASILFIWEGGLSLLGAITLGAPAAAIALRWTGLQIGRGLDAAAPAVAFGQAVGRLGCLFAGCAAGGPVAGNAMVPALLLPDAAGTVLPRFPSQLVEAGGEAALGVILMVACLRGTAPGTVAALYLLGYGLLRLAAEPMRADQILAGPVAVASLWSGAAVLAGAYWLYRSRRATAPMMWRRHAA